jgi:hypothetical protein
MSWAIHRSMVRTQIDCQALTGTAQADTEVFSLADRLRVVSFAGGGGESRTLIRETTSRADSHL